MKKTALAIMIVTLISKTAGFVREVALSHFYGASAVTDAYFVSQTIPTVIFAFIGAGIGTGFIPMYSRITHTQGAEAANRFTSNLVTTLCVLCTIIVGVSSIFSGPLVRLFASGFTGETLDLATRFTRISVFAIYFTGLSGLVGGYLRIHESYLVPNMVAIPSNLIIIIALVISSTTDIHVLLIGTVVGKASELLFPALFARKKGYRYAVIFDLGDENLRTMIRIAIPVIVGTSMTQINVIVDRALASGIEVGGISALNYANRLTTFVEGLFVMSTASVMYPMISKMASSQRIELLRNAVSESIGLINFMVVPVAVGAVVLAEPIVNLLFGHGAFTADASAMTSTALQFYSWYACVWHAGNSDPSLLCPPRNSDTNDLRCGGSCHEYRFEYSAIPLPRDWRSSVGHKHLWCCGNSVVDSSVEKEDRWIWDQATRDVVRQDLRLVDGHGRDFTGPLHLSRKSSWRNRVACLGRASRCRRLLWRCLGATRP